MTTPDRTVDDIPLTVMISTEKKTRGIVSIFDDVAAIKAIRVARDKISTIPDEWKTGCGFYILLSDIQDSTYYAYVGKATQNNFYARLSSHRREKGSWTHAFLFQRDTSNGLNSTQASYVEGTLHKIIQECPWISVINNQTAGDKTLADHEVFYMNQVVKSALRILNIFGYEIEEEPLKQKEKTESTGKKYYGVSIAHLVKAGLLEVGEDVLSLMDKYPATASVGPKGIIFEGEELAPSRAAVNAMKKDQGGAGWTFWGVIRADQWIPLSAIRDNYLSRKKLYENSLLTEENVDFDSAILRNELNKKEVAMSESRTAPESEGSMEVKVTSPEKDPERHKDSKIKVYELVDAGYLEEGMDLFITDSKYQLDDVTIFAGGISFNNNVYPAPTMAGKYAKRLFEPDAEPPNGWEFWAIQKYDGQLVTFGEILDDFMENERG